ncbi:hypothetical protein VEGS18_A45530 (plasmid) [Escherichia coli]|nr:hypothetical protein VEGS18_A45530 [Escherichia coli]BEC25656.1 hypothetical protein VEE50_44570 [Escherichia coli]
MIWQPEFTDKTLSRKPGAVQYGGVIPKNRCWFIRIRAVNEWQSFLKSHGLEGSMSRRGNCHDNAVAESFFQLLKRERIKKKIYGTREEARSDIFDYIEIFYNSKRRHGSSDQMSPTEYENQYYQRLGSV